MPPKQQKLTIQNIPSYALFQELSGKQLLSLKKTNRYFKNEIENNFKANNKIKNYLITKDIMQDLFYIPVEVIEQTENLPKTVNQWQTFIQQESIIDNRLIDYKLIENPDESLFYIYYFDADYDDKYINIYKFNKRQNKWILYFENSTQFINYFSEIAVDINRTFQTEIIPVPNIYSL